MFSKACEYGIRAVMYIVARTHDGSKAGIKEIARFTDSPEPFMAKILQLLSKKGIISSSKGPNGGFFVDGGPQIALIDIVRAVDGDNLFLSCGLGIKNCSERKPCPIHNQYKAIRENLIGMLKRSYIQDLADGVSKGETFLTKR